MSRADSTVYPLASAASATGSAVPIQGGLYAFHVNGTIGGATITLQVQQPDGTWAGVTSAGAAISATALPYSVSPIYLGAGMVRMAAASGTPSALNAWLAGIG